jgi:hypothetical protein
MLCVANKLIMLIVVMLNVVMLIVIMLNVVMLIVVAPIFGLNLNFKDNLFSDFFVSLTF